MLEPGTALDTDGSTCGGGRLPEEIQRGQAAQPAGLREPGGVCGAELSIPSSGRAPPSLHWEWTKKQRKHKLKTMLGLTHQWSRKLSLVNGLSVKKCGMPNVNVANGRTFKMEGPATKNQNAYR